MATRRRKTTSRRTTARRRTTATRRRKKKEPLLKFEVEKHIAREIWAVIYLSLAALTWLSLNQQLGFLGDLWVSGLHPVFGVGMEAVPVALAFMGASIFLSKKIEWGLARFTGISMVAAALLGFVHMGVPVEDALDVAAQGDAGGYIGFVSSFIFQAAFGTTGAWVLLTATLLVGGLLTFQVSLADTLRFLTPNPKKMKDAIKTVTPEFNILEDTDRVVEADELKIVQPLGGEEKPEAITSMTIKEVTPEEVERRLAEEDRVDENQAALDLPVKQVAEGEIIMVDEKPTKRTGKWEYPHLSLLSDNKETFSLNQKDLRLKAGLIKDKLEQFGIAVSMQEVHVGPTVVQYTLRPADGVKLSKITSLKNDLALALAARAVRIEAPIPGKSLVGIEIPNESRATVYQREVMETDQYKREKSKLKIALGRNVNGEVVVADLAKMPHLLIAGATGAGKSVGMNSFLMSLLYNNSPQELKFIMVDPKQVELTPYNGLPHLLTPVITDAEKAATSLRWAVAEMNRRYKVCAEAGARNVDEYNKGKHKSNRMCKIVIVIDELADLMMQAQKEVEASICRIAQMARAVGMHLIIATQRPSVDVITGLIKANIPARIAFTVASSIDSRTIIDSVGAEDLLGRGDMLYLSGTMGKPQRVQGIFVSTEEVESVCNRLKLTMEDEEPQYLEDITSKATSKIKVQGVPDVPTGPQTDEDLFQMAVACLRKNPKAASTSALQRYLKIGYSRAARIVDQLEENGIVGPSQGSKPREVLVNLQEEEVA